MTKKVRMMTAILFFGKTSEIDTFNLDGEIILCKGLKKQRYICDTGMTFCYNKNNVGNLRKEFLNHIGYDWVAKLIEKLENYGAENDRLALVFEQKEVRFEDL